jgi:hypothetical protein|tara:strand:- start:283 stop:480 length:198 start_codon:yes stop_codon:yes gene_type:complete
MLLARPARAGSLRLVSGSFSMNIFAKIDFGQRLTKKGKNQPPDALFVCGLGHKNENYFMSVDDFE